MKNDMKLIVETMRHFWRKFATRFDSLLWSWPEVSECIMSNWKLCVAKTIRDEDRHFLILKEGVTVQNRSENTSHNLRWSLAVLTETLKLTMTESVNEDMKQSLRLKIRHFRWQIATILASSEILRLPKSVSEDIYHIVWKYVSSEANSRQDLAVFTKTLKLNGSIMEDNASFQSGCAYRDPWRS